MLIVRPDRTRSMRPLGGVSLGAVLDMCEKHVSGPCPDCWMKPGPCWTSENGGLLQMFCHERNSFARTTAYAKRRSGRAVGIQFDERDAKETPPLRGGGLPSTHLLRRLVVSWSGIMIVSSSNACGPKIETNMQMHSAAVCSLSLASAVRVKAQSPRRDMMSDRSNLDVSVLLQTSFSANARTGDRMCRLMLGAGSFCARETPGRAELVSTRFYWCRSVGRANGQGSPDGTNSRVRREVGFATGWLLRCRSLMCAARLTKSAAEFTPADRIPHCLAPQGRGPGVQHSGSAPRYCSAPCVPRVPTEEPWSPC